ncbi:UNVERIFIED_CONTAM: hypothetical protein GTU68_032657 [Idotea baltica]|nr:hypothetical protein [Idotea baltica]
MAVSKRCDWCGDDPIYVAYHDTEWGVPQFDSRTLYEKLMLDGFQAGLSWITILRKRDGFRDAFKGFEPEVVARFGKRDVERLVKDERIVRHRGKIEATIGNAQAYLKISETESFSDYLWKWVDGKPIQNRMRTMADVPGQTELSQAISKQLKKDGFKFCGPTIVYAVMQAMGMVNDHMVDCPRHKECAALAKGK